MRSVCSVRRNPHGPARFTGAHLRWMCETPDGVTYCDTRESARSVAAAYNAERRALIREGMRAQGRTVFWEADNRA